MSQRNDAKNAEIMTRNREAFMHNMKLSQKERRELLTKQTPWSADKIERILQRIKGYEVNV